MAEHKTQDFFFFTQFLKMFDPGWKIQQPIRVGVAFSSLLIVVRKLAARAVDWSHIFHIQPKHTSHS